jgi:GAF domain-containing protein
MKGIARSGGEPALGYEAVVLAFSRLSHAVITDQPAGRALATAAETAAQLLGAESAVVYLTREPLGEVYVAAAHALDVSTGQGTLPGVEMVRECITSSRAVVLSSLVGERQKGIAALAKLGVASAICVPLMAADHTVGALAVMSTVSRSFSAGEIDLLSAIGDQAALAAWRAHGDPTRVNDAGTLSVGELMDLAEQRIRELSIVNRVSEAVISTLDLAKLLTLALDECLTAVGATVGSIMLLDEDSGTLSIKASKNIDSDVVKKVSVKVGEGISGWVAEHGQPVLVQDARRDPRFQMNRYRDDISSAMSVPLKARGRVIGVLNASTVVTGRRYGPREIEFLTTVANQAAMAIDNARLYVGLEHRSKELAGLLNISEAITSTLDLREVVSLLSSRFLAMAKVDVSALLVFDADNARFRCLDGQGLSIKSKKGMYLELSRSIAKLVLESGEPVVADVSEGSELASEVSVAAQLSCGVGVPLVAAGRLVGVVTLFSGERKAFSDGELVTLTALGKLAGVAVHNALIYQHKYEIARSLQFQLVPNVPLKAEGLEIGHKFSPAREVGGDYYDLIRVLPGKVGVVIADVAGNSVPAAMYTSMGKNVLLAYAVDNESPSDVLRRLNRIACQQTQAEVFISLFYGVFDAATRTFRYACAGHEPPILLHPDGSFEKLYADGLLVGISDAVGYEEKSVVLEQGAVLVMFTDGLVDSPAVRGKFGVNEIVEIVSSNMLKPSQELADNIYETLMETAGSRVQDDVALVVLKVL